MSHLTTTLCVSTALILNSVMAYAQTPDSISYQAVVRDAAGNELTNQSVTIEFAIHKGSSSGLIVFEENHNLVPTNQFGLFTAMIGNGTDTGVGIYNSLSEIAWQDDTYFLEVRAAIPGEGTTQIIGVSQLLAVPYAFYATTAGTVLNEADGDPENELIDDFSIDGNVMTITEDGIEHSIDLTSFTGGADDDADSLNEVITSVTLSPANMLTLTEGTHSASCDLATLAEHPWTQQGNVIYSGNESIGIGTSAPTSTLSVNGNLALSVMMLNGEVYDMSANGDNANLSVFICDVTAQDVSIELMSAADCPGRIYKFRKIFSGVVTSNDVNLYPILGETIDNYPLFEMTHVYSEYLTIISNGAGWYVIDHGKE